MLLGLGGRKGGQKYNQSKFREEQHCKLMYSNDNGTSLIVSVPTSPDLAGSLDRAAGDGPTGFEPDSECYNDNTEGKFFPALSSIPTQSVKSEEGQTADNTIVPTPPVFSSSTPVSTPVLTIIAPPVVAAPTNQSGPSPSPVQARTDVFGYSRISSSVGSGKGAEGRRAMKSSNHGGKRDLAPAGEAGGKPGRQLSLGMLPGEGLHWSLFKWDADHFLTSVEAQRLHPLVVRPPPQLAQSTSHISQKRKAEEAPLLQVLNFAKTLNANCSISRELASQECRDFTLKTVMMRH